MLRAAATPTATLMCVVLCSQMSLLVRGIALKRGCAGGRAGGRAGAWDRWQEVQRRRPKYVTMLLKRVEASDGPTDLVSCTCDTERCAVIDDLGASISSSASGTVPPRPIVCCGPDEH